MSGRAGRAERAFGAIGVQEQWRSQGCPTYALAKPAATVGERLTRPYIQPSRGSDVDSGKEVSSP